MNSGHESIGNPPQRAAAASLPGGDLLCRLAADHRRQRRANCQKRGRTPATSVKDTPRP